MEEGNQHANIDDSINEEKKNREIYDMMQNENIDIYGDFFTFRNVLLTAVVMGVLILLFYMFG